jgi:3-hydroxybutyryl-CoA dehydrogenase
MTPLHEASVLVVGAGIMGAGIAQVAAQAGHEVLLFDARDGAAIEAHGKLAASLDALATKGKLKPEAVAATLKRIRPVARLAEAADVGLVVEAIVERLDAKRGLLRELEAVVAADCVLASNTSSISVTALANGLRHPERVVGMHFFNPVPLMKLVEVVSGLQTERSVADAVFELSTRWGKTAVHARSTPGFIVNRIARPYYAETLALLQAQAAPPAVLDACLRAAGFRMGPCELMDLIGHDTNFAVTSSVYEANFYDKRFVPSLVQKELVDGGLLGRKSGQGFYRYPDGAPALPPPVDASPKATRLVVHGNGPVADRLAALPGAVREPGSDWIGLEADGAQLRLTDGRCAAELAAQTGVSAIAVFDLPIGASPGALAWAAAPAASQHGAAAWLGAAGFAPQRIADVPGLVVARTVAMLINEAADAVHQGVCSAAEADTAMKLGVNYPAGPFEWLQRWHAGAVVALLERLDAHHRGERYRVSPWLRQRAWATTAG